MKKTLIIFVLSLFLTLVANINNAEAYTPEGFSKFINYIQAMARRKGVSEKTLHQAFRDVKVNYKVIALDRKQPERKKGPGFDSYKANMVTAKRIETAQTILNDNRNLLNDIERKYGVEKEILVALWGVESGFGKVMGNYSIINSLTTLAYEGRRSVFFQDELIKALIILDQGHVEQNRFKGSWAGAFGQFQFMPSTFLDHAVDNDGDGKKNLWYDNGDALASAANYLKDIGWEKNIGWGKRVIAPANIAPLYIGKEFSMPVNKWKQLGLKYADGSSLPYASFNASLIDPDGASGSRKELYLVTDNFRRIMEWNRSTYFATSIGLIADSIR